MDNRNSAQINNERQLIAERTNVLTAYRDMTTKYKQTKHLVADLYYEVNKKEILLEDESLEVHQKSMLKYDFTMARRELEKAIYQKEILNKDITILQNRIKHLENEIRKTKPWWRWIFIPA